MRNIAEAQEGESSKEGNGLASEAAQRWSNNEDGKTSFELEGTFVTLVRRGTMGHGSKS